MTTSHKLQLLMLTGLLGLLVAHMIRLAFFNPVPVVLLGFCFATVAIGTGRVIDILRMNGFIK